MLKKIETIKNLGVFRDFSWDSEVKSNGGAVQSLAHINIIYGRNYSGKTTLSRIVRALETGVLSDKYGSPSFQLKFTDNSDVTPSTLAKAFAYSMRTLLERTYVLLPTLTIV
jgi:AAA15 family ATPase/GTPase